jgi:hypothetical protein
MSSITGNRTVFILALLAVGFATASLTAVTPLAFAQTGGNMGDNAAKNILIQNNLGDNNTQGNLGNNTMMPPMMMGQITGSINVKQEIKNFLTDNVNTTLADAVSTAESQVNATAFAAHIDVVQGYLAYTVILADLNTDNINIVIVDAGNGSVLSSQTIPFDMFSAMHGHGAMMGGQGGMMGGSGGMTMMPPPSPPGNETMSFVAPQA